MPVQLAHGAHRVDGRGEEARQRLLVPVIGRVGSVDRQQDGARVRQRDLERLVAGGVPGRLPHADRAVTEEVVAVLGALEQGPGDAAACCSRPGCSRRPQTSPARARIRTRRGWRSTLALGNSSMAPIAPVWSRCRCDCRTKTTSAGSKPAALIAGTHACSGFISGQYTSVMPPQWPTASSAHCAALPPSITTIALAGASTRNHGTGISYSSPSPWFILMFSTWHLSVPHSNMYSGGRRALPLRVLCGGARCSLLSITSWSWTR